MRDTQGLKKLVVAVVLVGTFIVYSLLHDSSGATVLTPISAPVPSTTPNTPAATSASGATPGATATGTSGSQYKNGTYTGNVADAQWGNVQVQAVIQNGKITTVQFLQYPNDRNRSIEINSYADPILDSEAIQAQSAQVDIVSGATDSSLAFMQSLGNALSQAQA